MQCRGTDQNLRLDSLALPPRHRIGTAHYRRIRGAREDRQADSDQTRFRGQRCINGFKSIQGTGNANLGRSGRVPSRRDVPPLLSRPLQRVHRHRAERNVKGFNQRCAYRRQLSNRRHLRRSQVPTHEQAVPAERQGQHGVPGAGLAGKGSFPDKPKRARGGWVPTHESKASGRVRGDHHEAGENAGEGRN